MEYSCSTYLTPNLKKSVNYFRVSHGSLSTQKKRAIHLSGSIDLRLPCVLSLTEHSGRQELVPVLPAHQIRRLQEDGSTVVPRHRLPLCLRGERAIDGLRDDLLVRLVVLAQRLRVVGGDELLCGSAFLNLSYRGSQIADVGTLVMRTRDGR